MVRSGKVFFDGKLVSSNRNYSRTSIHTFSIDSNSYSLILEVIQLLRGTSICTLLKNGKPLKRVKLTMLKFDRKRIFKNMLKMTIIYGCFFVLLVSLFLAEKHYGLPRAVMLTVVGALLLGIGYYIYKYGDGSKPKIEEQDAV